MTAADSIRSPMIKANNSTNPSRDWLARQRRIHLIKRQQRLLLLLRHSCSCPAPEGLCPVTPFCSSTKNLWKHVTECTDINCTVTDCSEATYILSHFRKCTSSTCVLCVPMRQSMAHNRARAMKQV